MNRAVTFGLVLAAFALPASAQSVTPMRGVTKSFADDFAIRLTVGNPYQRPVQFDVRVYDEDFNPVAEALVPKALRIGAKDTRQITVRVPFEGSGQRKIRVCAEGLFGRKNMAAIRTQVCGRFLGLRVGS